MIIPVQNNNIVISKTEWAAINAAHSRIQIIDALVNTIIDQDIRLPMREISYSDMIEDFQALQSFAASDNIVREPWFTRYPYDSRWFFHDVLISTNSTGNRSSDYFHQDARWRCDSIGAPSPYRTWHSRKFLTTLLPALWSMKFEEVNPTVLRSIIGLRKYIAAQFRPLAAKTFYDTVSARNILDISAGWGDRLSGFMASGAISYMGVDPNNAVQIGYDRQTMELIPSYKTAIFMEKGAEDMEYKTTFDTIFTSPPYFNLERYSQDPSQSFKKFKKLDAWLDGFLFPSLSKAWDALEPNGIMGINISDVYSGHVINKICDPMNEHLASLPDAQYIGAIGYEMRKRPNSGAIKGKTGRFAEPIWMWRKDNATNPFIKEHP